MIFKYIGSFILESGGEKMIGPIQIELAQIEKLLSAANIIIPLIFGMIMIIGMIIVAYDTGYRHGHGDAMMETVTEMQRTLGDC